MLISEGQLTCLFFLMVTSTRIKRSTRNGGTSLQAIFSNDQIPLVEIMFVFRIDLSATKSRGKPSVSFLTIVPTC